MNADEFQPLLPCIVTWLIVNSPCQLQVTASSIKGDGALPVTVPGTGAVAALPLVVSLFPNIGLLDMAFEEAGFCVVRGPDLIFGGDIRRFNPPPNKFGGVIGGPPCQDFSAARRCPPTGNGVAMLKEFIRVVNQAQPDWWLMENVPGVPDIHIDGYNWQRLDVRASDFGLTQRRLRHIQFGSRHNMVLVLERNESTPETDSAVMASDRDTPFSKMCALQGLPPDFDLPSFTVAGKRRAVGNGVPLPMGRALATAVVNMVHEDSVSMCACRCGRVTVGKQMYADGAACRMRAKRRRDRHTA